MSPDTWKTIPCVSEQGIIPVEQGIKSSDQGVYQPDQGIPRWALVPGSVRARSRAQMSFRLHSPFSRDTVKHMLE
jgi:hypothetical protein